MYEMKKSFCLIIVLALLLGILSVSASALRIERNQDTVLITREEGDPDTLFVAEYDENGRMTAVHEVSESYSVDIGSGAKIFQADKSGNPASEAIDVAAMFDVFTIEFGTGNDRFVKDEVFDKPIRVKHIGGDGGNITFDNCRFENGIIIETDSDVSFSVDFSDNCIGNAIVEGTNPPANRIQGNEFIEIFRADGMSFELNRRATVFSDRVSHGITINGILLTEQNGDWLNAFINWMPSKFDEAGNITSSDRLGITLQGGSCIFASGTLSGTIRLSREADVTAIDMTDGAIIEWSGDDYAHITASSQSIHVPEFTDARELAVDFTGAGSIEVDGNRWLRLTVNGTVIDQTWLNRWNNGHGYSYNITFGSEEFEDEGDKRFFLVNGDHIIDSELDRHDGWTTVNSDEINEGTQIWFSLNDDIYVRFNRIARDWEREIPFHEFARWICERLEERGKLDRCELTENKALLEAVWPNYFWAEEDVTYTDEQGNQHTEHVWPWGSDEDRLVLSYVLSIKGFELDADNYENPNYPVRYGTAASALGALTGGENVTLDYDKPAEETLAKFEVDDLLEKLVRKLPKDSVDGDVIYLLNNNRYSTDNGTTWSETDTVSGKSFSGKVQIINSADESGYIGFENCEFKAGVSVIGTSDRFVQVDFRGSCEGAVSVSREGSAEDMNAEDVNIGGADNMTVEMNTRGNVSSDGGAVQINGINITPPEHFHGFNIHIDWDEIWDNGSLTGYEKSVTVSGDDYGFDYESAEFDNSRALTLSGTLTNKLRVDGAIDLDELNIAEGGKVWLSGDQSSYINAGANDIWVDGGVRGSAGEMYIFSSGVVQADATYARLRVNGVPLRAKIIDDREQTIIIELGEADNLTAENIIIDGRTLTKLGNDDFELYSDCDYIYLRLDKDLFDWRYSDIELEIIVGSGRVKYKPVLFSVHEQLTMSDFAARMINDFFDDYYYDEWRDYSPSVEGMRVDPRALNFLIDYADFDTTRVEGDHWNFWNIYREDIRYGDAKRAFTNLYCEILGDEDAVLPISVLLFDGEKEWQDDYSLQVWAYDQMREAFELVLPRKTVETDQFLSLVRYSDGREFINGEENNNVTGKHFTGAVSVTNDTNLENEDYAGAIFFRNCEFDSDITVSAINGYHYNLFFFGCDFNNGAKVNVTGASGSVGIYGADNEPVNVASSDGFGGEVKVIGNVDISQCRGYVEQLRDDNWEEFRESHIAVGSATLHVYGYISGRQNYTAAEGGTIIFRDGPINLEPVINGTLLRVDGRDNYISFCNEGGGSFMPEALWHQNGENIRFEVDAPDENGWGGIRGDFNGIRDVCASLKNPDGAEVIFAPVPNANERQVGIMEFMNNLADIIRRNGGAPEISSNQKLIEDTFPNFNFEWFNDDSALLTYAIDRGKIGAGEYNSPFDAIRYSTALRIVSAVWTEMKGSGLPDYVRIREWGDEESADWTLNGYNRDELLEKLDDLLSGRGVTSEEELAAAFNGQSEIMVLSDITITGELVIPAGSRLYVEEGASLTVASGASLTLGDGFVTLTAGEPVYGNDEVQFNIEYYPDGNSGFARAFAAIDIDGCIKVEGQLHLGAFAEIHNNGVINASGRLELCEGEPIITGYIDGDGFTESEWDDNRGGDGWIDVNTGANIFNNGELHISGSTFVGVYSGIHVNAGYNTEDGSEHSWNGSIIVEKNGELSVYGEININSDCRPNEDGTFRFSKGEAVVYGKLEHYGRINNNGLFEIKEGGAINAHIYAAVDNNGWIDEYNAVQGEFYVNDGGALSLDKADFNNNGLLVIEGVVKLEGSTEPDEFGNYWIPTLTNNRTVYCGGRIEINSGIVHNFSSWTLLGEMAIGSSAKFVDHKNEDSVFSAGENAVLTLGIDDDDPDNSARFIAYIRQNEDGTFDKSNYESLNGVDYALYVHNAAGFTNANGAFRVFLEDNVFYPDPGNYTFYSLYTQANGGIIVNKDVTVASKFIRNSSYIGLRGGTLNYDELYGNEIDDPEVLSLRFGIEDGSVYWPKWGYLNVGFYKNISEDSIYNGVMTSSSGEEINFTGMRGAHDYRSYILNLGGVELKLNEEYTAVIPANTIRAEDGTVYEKELRIHFLTPENVVEIAFDDYSDYLGMDAFLCDNNGSRMGYSVVSEGSIPLVFQNVEPGEYEIVIEEEASLGWITVEADKISSFALGKPEKLAIYRRGDDAEIYDAVLGAYEALLDEAEAEADLDTRYVKYAKAEAELLDSAVMIPTTTQGGAYAISRVAPHTMPYVQWGSDDDRMFGMVISDEFISKEERADLLALWESAVAGEGTYDPAAYLVGKGHKIQNTYATTFSIAPYTLDWLNTSAQSDTELLVNCVDGLIQYDNLGRMQPALAENWNVSDDGLTYTFNIRRGVKWFTYDGKEYADVTAHDFVNGFRHMLDSRAGLEGLTEGIVAGVSEYLEGGSFDNVGYKAQDDYTLVVTLERPTPYFMTMLSYTCFLPYCESYADSCETFGYSDSPANQVYCGAYLITVLSEEELRIEKNPNYYNADKVTLESISWYYDNGGYPEEVFNDVLNGKYAGTGLSAGNGSLNLAISNGLFDKYAYVSDTTSTSYFGALNLNRGTFELENGAAASPKNVQEKIDAHTALLNKNFRKALQHAFDKTAYNAVSRGEDLAQTNLRNMYTHPKFAILSKDVTLDGHTFKEGTFYGDVVQYYIGNEIDVHDQVDGWYNPTLAKSYLEAAKEELSDTVTFPIMIDVVYFAGSDANTAQANAYKTVVESTLGADNVIVNLIAADNSADYYASGYRAGSGYDGNFDMFFGSGWGPDYGDPSTYLDTFRGYGRGYMTKTIGLF